MGGRCEEVHPADEIEGSSYHCFDILKRLYVIQKVSFDYLRAEQCSKIGSGEYHLIHVQRKCETGEACSDACLAYHVMRCLKLTLTDFIYLPNNNILKSNVCHRFCSLGNLEMFQTCQKTELF